MTYRIDFHLTTQSLFQKAAGMEIDDYFNNMNFYNFCRRQTAYSKRLTELLLVTGMVDSRLFSEKHHGENILKRQIKSGSTPHFYFVRLNLVSCTFRLHEVVSVLSLLNVRFEDHSFWIIFVT